MNIVRGPHQEFTDQDFRNIQKLAGVASEDVENLQRHIREDPRTIIDEAEPVIEPAKSDDTLSSLSAEDVAAQYETAVKALEDMGLAVQKRIEQLDHALRECHKDMRLLIEVAHVIRDKKVQIP